MGGTVDRGDDDGASSTTSLAARELQSLQAQVITKEISEGEGRVGVIEGDKDAIDEEGDGGHDRGIGRWRGRSGWCYYGEEEGAEAVPMARQALVCAGAIATTHREALVSCC